MNSIGSAASRGRRELSYVERDNRSPPKAWVIEFVTTATTKKRGLWVRRLKYFVHAGCTILLGRSHNWPRWQRLRGIGLLTVACANSERNFSCSKRFEDSRPQFEELLFRRGSPSHFLASDLLLWDGKDLGLAAKPTARNTEVDANQAAH